MTTEYKDALAAFNSLKSLNRYCFIVNDTYIKNPEGDDSFISRNEINSILKPHGETIRRALRIADALMQEPSEAEVRAGINLALNTTVCGNRPWPSYITMLRNTMRDQLLKEVDDETPKAD